jgi:hypothetical protein
MDGENDEDSSESFAADTFGGEEVAKVSTAAADTMTVRPLFVARVDCGTCKRMANTPHPIISGH